MAFIEQIEIDSLKEAFKSINLYIIWFLFLTVLLMSGSPSLSWAPLVLLSFAFAIIFTVDIKEQIIPDSTQIAIFILANILIFISPQHNIVLSYAGAGFSFAIFYTLHYVYQNFLNKPALGFGDVKLFGNAGLLIGFFYFNNFLLVLSAMSLTFLLIKIGMGKNDRIPYGPFIVSSIWLCLLYQESINDLVQSGILKIVEFII